MRTYGPVPVGTEAWWEAFEASRATMASSKLRRCPDCQHPVSGLAETCPSCGRPLRSPAPREGLFLRTLNQGLALAVWGPLLILGVLLAVALIARVLWFR
jgi:hypothetical protein